LSIRQSLGCKCPLPTSPWGQVDAAADDDDACCGYEQSHSREGEEEDCYCTQYCGLGVAGNREI